LNEEIGIVEEAALWAEESLHQKRRSIVVNLFAGPGTGKSTLAAGVFYQLKQQGINAEMAREYAKDSTWREDKFALGVQPYITTKQYFRQCMLDGKVDVIISDGPLPFGLIYRGRGCTQNFDRWVMDLFWEFHNLNYFLTRCEERGYQEAGRSQKEHAAKEKDLEIEQMLHKCSIPFKTLPMDLEGNCLQAIVADVLRALEIPR
jgi:hypothetical protein